MLEALKQLAAMAQIPAATAGTAGIGISTARRKLRDPEFQPYNGNPETFLPWIVSVEERKENLRHVGGRIGRKGSGWLCGGGGGLSARPGRGNKSGDEPGREDAETVATGTRAAHGAAAWLARRIVDC